MENLSKYTDDPKFIQWIFNPDSEIQSWWEHFQSVHPDEKRNIQLARKVLIQLKTNDQDIREEQKIKLFLTILKQIEEKQKAKNRIRQIAGWTKYAAIALIFFAIGAIFFYQKDHFNQQFYAYSLFNEPVAGEPTQLILADGQIVRLNANTPNIEVDAEGNFMVEGKPANKIATTSGMNRLVVPWGKLANITLADNTSITLNAGSQLVFPGKFSGKDREVFLIGQAYFDVSKNKKHPFVVQTQEVRINVLGTKFVTSAYPDNENIETTLTEGKVSLSRNHTHLYDQPVEMSPGQTAVFNRLNKETSIQNIDKKSYISWQKQLLRFESTELHQITSELAKFYQIQFSFTTTKLQNIRISGKLDMTESKVEIMERISRAASVNLTEKERNHYVITN